MRLPDNARANIAGFVGPAASFRASPFAPNLLASVDLVTLRVEADWLFPSPDRNEHGQARDPFDALGTALARRPKLLHARLNIVGCLNPDRIRLLPAGLDRVRRQRLNLIERNSRSISLEQKAISPFDRVKPERYLDGIQLEASIELPPNSENMQFWDFPSLADALTELRDSLYQVRSTGSDQVDLLSDFLRDNSHIRKLHLNMCKILSSPSTQAPHALNQEEDGVTNGDPNSLSQSHALEEVPGLNLVHMREDRLVDAVRNCPGLSTLILSNAGLAPAGSGFRFMSNFGKPGYTCESSLTSLDFSYNNSGPACGPLFAELLSSGEPLVEDFEQSEFPHLCKLDLGFNQIGLGAASFFDRVMRNRSLCELCMGGNDLDDSVATLLSGILMNHPTLISLDLTWNRFTDATFVTCAQSLADNRVLRVLDLGGNRLGDLTGCAFALTLAADTCALSTLGLANNQLRESGSQIASALKANTTLRYLDLSGNRIHVLAVQSLAETLKTNTSLDTLLLKNTVSTRQTRESISEALVD